ncbi:MAG TPA: glycosyltransferase family 2 protein [Hanamia sp.]|nr:glycosyltransferase family 2 protein [Hanamia sp.]
MSKIFSIIVTYNGASWIEKCLHDLLESNIKTEVIVIDNASSDNTTDILSSFESIHLIKNKENLGFGQANNLGIDLAMKNSADFIFLLNQDAYVFKNTISQLVDSLKEYPDFGVLSPLQLHINGKEIEPVFKNFLRRNFSDEIIHQMLAGEDHFNLHKPYAMRFVNAAAWMISRKCILKTGLFHPVFFHYGEDNHYASRVQFHGMKIGVLPAAHVIHDCKKEITDSYDLLVRKIKNVPLYTLLDLRKPFPVAYFLAYLKWRRLAKKLLKYQNPQVVDVIEEQKKWFSSKLEMAKNIRLETKNFHGKW